MNKEQLKNDIFDANHPESQIKAAYQMRYVQNDPEIVRILFSACYEAINPKLQQEAVRSLGVLRPDRALVTFTKSTHSHNAGKRMRAYYHLGTLGVLQGIDVVIKGFGDSDEKVRKAAVVSAGRLGRNFEVINALKRLLNGFEPDFIKGAAKVSIDMVKQRMNGQGANDRRSFSEKHSFNKTNYNPNKAYTPRGF